MYPEFIVIYIGLFLLLLIGAANFFLVFKLMKTGTHSVSSQRPMQPPMTMNDYSAPNYAVNTAMDVSTPGANVVFCKKCAAEFNANLKVCPKCGTPR